MLKAVFSISTEEESLVISFTHTWNSIFINSLIYMENWLFLTFLLTCENPCRDNNWTFTYISSWVFVLFSKQNIKHLLGARDWIKLSRKTKIPKILCLRPFTMDNYQLLREGRATVLKSKRHFQVNSPKIS